MWPRLTCCQGSNLRAWITLVVLVQCALILLYWDATRGGTSSASASSKSYRLQTRASHDHLQAQGAGAMVSETTLRHLTLPRHGKSDNLATRDDVRIDRNVNFKHSDGAVDRKLTFSEDNGGKTSQEVSKGRLITPGTEQLLYKSLRKQKDPTLLSDAVDAQSQRGQEVLQFAREETKDKTFNLTGNDRTHYEQGKPRPQSSESQVKLPVAQHQNQSQTIANSSNATTSLIYSKIRPNTSTISEITHSSFTEKSNTLPSVEGMNKVYENYKRFEMNRLKNSQINVSNISHVENQSVPTIRPMSARTDLKLESRTKIGYRSSTKELFDKISGNNQIQTTTPFLKLTTMHRDHPRLTFNKPIPTDPYDLETLKPLYQIGTKKEFQRATPELPDVFHLPKGENIEEKYFVKKGLQACFSEGTVSLEAEQSQQAWDKPYPTGCLCRRGWHGHQCSIPESVFSSTGARFVELLKPRTTARRVISALAFNVEFELLEARLNELDDVVDVFIILESNYTNYGESKPLHLLQRLRDGYLKKFQHKIVYLFRGKIPKGGRDDGWLVDQHMRMFIGQEGMQRVTNTAPDDIFLYTDADEIPNRQSILFLRMHDGYSEPFGVSLRWSVFGFFWKQIEPTRVLVGCTVGMFRYVFNNDAYQLRSTDYQNQASDKLHAYIASGAHIYDWHMGDNGVLSGWHCSWCLPPSRIRIKLTSAINADFPRWGDFPDKLEIPYLRNLVKTGTWFDDKTRFGMLVSRLSEETFAPQYILNNSDRFTYLLNLEDA